MATTASAIFTDVTDRIRDPLATMCATDTPPTLATGKAFIYAIATYAQTLVNTAERLIVKSANLALSTSVTLYLVSSLVSDLVTLLRVNIPGVGNIDGPVDYKAFGRHSRGWLTGTGANVVAWSQCGKDILFFVPAVAASAPTVTLTYLPVLNTISADGNILQVPDDTTTHVARLTELVCRIKSRQLDGFADRLKGLASDMKMSLDVGAKKGIAL